MKRIEDIEKMELEELESAALGEDIPVPPGLEERIKASLASEAALEDRKRVRYFPGWAPYAAIAVAASLALVAILPKGGGGSLMDTYDNPYLACEQVEETFRIISEKMAAGVDLAGKAGETADKTMEIINKFTEK